MIKENLFWSSLKTLTDAYRNDELSHSPCGCAIGNLVAKANGYKLIHNPKADSERERHSWDGESSKWQTVFCTMVEIKFECDEIFKHKTILHPGAYHGDAKRQIDSTGYSWPDLMNMEQAFEGEWFKHKDYDDSMFHGLLKVVDVLIRIHEYEGDSVKQPFEEIYQS